MPKRLLVINYGEGVPVVLRVARGMGVRVVLIGPTAKPMPDSIAKELALCGGEWLRGDGTDAAFLVRVAREQEVKGIFPAPPPAMVAVALATEELGLPGPCLPLGKIDRVDWRIALPAQWNVPWRDVMTEAEATTAVTQLGTPVVFKAADGRINAPVCRLDYVEDTTLVVGQMRRAGISGRLLIERWFAGPIIRVDGFLREGRFIPHGMIEEVAAPGMCFALAAATPVMARIDKTTMVEAASAGFAAAGWTVGMVHATIALTEDGIRLLNIHAYPSILRYPCDLIELSGGASIAARCMRVAMGEGPGKIREPKQGAAIAWLRAKSGSVARVEGGLDMMARPGVAEFAIHVQPGDRLGHEIDRMSRDRLGYVALIADTAETALIQARAAADLCHIRTSPTVSG